MKYRGKNRTHTDNILCPATFCKQSVASCLRHGQRNLLCLFRDLGLCFLIPVPVMTGQYCDHSVVFRGICELPSFAFPYSLLGIKRIQVSWSCTHCKIGEGSIVWAAVFAALAWIYLTEYLGDTSDSLAGTHQPLVYLTTFYRNIGRTQSLQEPSCDVCCSLQNGPVQMGRDRFVFFMLHLSYRNSDLLTGMLVKSSCQQSVFRKLQVSVPEELLHFL